MDEPPSTPSVPPAGALPDPSVDTLDLRTLLAVARTGQVSRAAKLLGKTQPSVSGRLAALERRWGRRLFRRLPRGVELTPEGARLLPLVETALATLEELDRAAGLPTGDPGELRVGAGDALGQELLPRVFAQLRHTHPELEVRLVERPADALLEDLVRGAIDVALVPADEWSRRPEGIEFARLLESPVTLLVPPDVTGDHPLELLHTRPLIGLHERSRFRRHLDACLAVHGLRRPPALEVGSFSLVRRYVAAGLGVGCVPAVALEAEPRDVRCVPLPQIPRITYERAVRRGSVLSEPTRELIRLLSRE